MEHLSSIANDVVLRCSQELGSTIDEMVEEFECQWKPGAGGTYSRKFVEYCNSKAMSRVCQNIPERIKDGSFTRLTFDMMLAWQQPDVNDNEFDLEAVGKESEDKRIQATLSPEQDDISLFYSDIMPLLADHEPNVGHQLHFPAYDMFVKEIHKCMKYLQKQTKPKGVDLADDEIILHVEGTMASQRVVRHIKKTSWPGRRTLTNYGLYFEAAGIINYEDALKVDLTKDGASSAKPISTGPWGAPLFDKAIVYESPDFEDGVILEFPEMTSSTRRDHWLMLLGNILKEAEEDKCKEKGKVIDKEEMLVSLESAVNQTREEGKEIEKAKATTAELEEEGITESVAVLMELMRPMQDALPWFQEVLNWERPSRTLFVLSITILIVYKMAQARQMKLHTKSEDAHVNITIMKLRSIYTSKASKHASMVMASILALAIFFAVVPFKLVIMFGTIYCFVMTSSVGRYMSNDQSNRRMKEWWDSIPIVPVRVLNSASK
ncbi:BnaA09g42940D [Brassica napus]|uniref:BnaA09g42940D protein n=1 Tax=Brassica napus TaxID=3708 RepID=A0A078FLC0_BRANA|nr:BnaA09g42940D [Brassica napus]